MPFADEPTDGTDPAAFYGEPMGFTNVAFQERAKVARIACVLAPPPLPISHTIFTVNVFEAFTVP